VSWRLEYRDFRPQEERLREALCTLDHEFLSHYGAEMFLEIARFWGSFATYCEKHGGDEACRL
jgi:trehalose/maltose hydrolase-like predicted phosphorylase